MGKKFRSRCAIASALEIIGDKWTLVVIRSLMLGATSYSELLAAPEKIATNILADRLVRLEQWGLLEAVPSPAGAMSRREYHLTPAGAELLPVLQAIAAWGEAHLPDRWHVPDWFRNAAPEDFLHRPPSRIRR
jgi:DNA-binding HxlR family transcriptional regulator